MFYLNNKKLWILRLFYQRYWLNINKLIKFKIIILINRRIYNIIIKNKIR
jgi:hypothetical protein